MLFIIAAADDNDDNANDRKFVFYEKVPPGYPKKGRNIVFQAGKLCGGVRGDLHVTLSPKKAFFSASESRSYRMRQAQWRNVLAHAPKLRYDSVPIETPKKIHGALDLFGNGFFVFTLPSAAHPIGGIHDVDRESGNS